MVNSAYLETALTEPCEKQLDILGPEFEEISRHIGRANYVEAATAVERLFQQGIFDVRLLGFFLFGVFTERQIAGLPVVLECLVIVLRQSLPFMGPSDKKEPQLDSALRWLFSKVVQHVEHYKRDKDPRYEQWQQPEYAAAREAGLRHLQALEEALGDTLPDGRAIQMLRHVRTLLQGLCLQTSSASPFPVSATAALQEREERLLQLAEDSQSSDPESEGAPTEVAKDEEPPFDQPLESEAVAETGVDESPGETRPDQDDTPASLGEPRILPNTPALNQLIKKLTSVESLCSQGHLGAAALVVAELRQVLVSPYLRQVLIAFLGGYYRCVIQHGKELQREILSMSADSASEELERQALRELYQTDFDLFLSVVQRGSP